MRVAGLLRSVSSLRSWKVPLLACGAVHAADLRTVSFGLVDLLIWKPEELGPGAQLRFLSLKPYVVSTSSSVALKIDASESSSFTMPYQGTVPRPILYAVLPRLSLS
jgi:hypothetical protein